jgi:hypothetical protein
LSKFKFKIVNRPGKQGQKPDALTRMPGDIRPKGVAEKTQQIVLKTENLNKELRKNLVVAFMETVNLDNDSVYPDKLWNWVKNVCKQCPELCTHRKELLEVSELHKSNRRTRISSNGSKNAMTLQSQNIQDEQKPTTD